MDKKSAQHQTGKEKVPSEDQQESNLERNDILDYVRGLAIFLMVVAHVTVFINNNSNAFLGGLAQLIDIIAFTVFLMVSGAVAYLAYLDRKETKKMRSSIVDRSFNLLVAYFIVSLVAILPELSKDFARKTLEILFFLRSPSYSEFLIPFIVYGFSLIPLRNFYKKIASNLKLLIIVGLSAYILGWLLYQVPYPKSLSYYMSFVSGYSDWFRFPLLQYFPVFLVGIYFGRIFQGRELSIERFIKYGVVINIAFMVFLVLGLVSNTAPAELLERWPPTPLFLLAGTIAFVLMYVGFSLLKGRIPLSFLSYMGKHASAFYIYHIIILYLYRHYVNIVAPPLLPTIVSLGIVLGITTLFLELIKLFRAKI